MMRVGDLSRTAAIVLCLLGCNVWKAVTKTLQEDNDIKEVTLKVHLSDASTHQPLGGATIELFANHTPPVTTETSAADGNAYLRFPYRLGTLLVVTATRQGYVPNSAPWRPTRLPVFSSLSLELLPERAATLMVYEDLIQINSGSQGLRGQSWVQFQRRALSLPPNSSYSNLTALLTVANNPSHIQHFPYLQGLGGNGTGSERRFELTPVAAISVHLLASKGVELQVNGPISISVPLPANSGLKENQHIPAWRFDPSLGAWLKSSLGYVQREGDQLSLTYIAPQLGYWVATMSPLDTGPVVTKDISTYHTVFLLAILGGMAVILLCLLCLLLYYCRRGCVKPRLSHRKLNLSSGLEGSKRDQATSMSHLNLISSEVHLELVSTTTEPDMTTPMLKPSSYDCHDLVSHGNHSRMSLGNHSQSRHGSSLGNLTPRSKDYRQSVETFPLKSALSTGTDAGYRQSYTSICSSTNQLPDRLSSSNQVQASAAQLSGVGEGATSVCEATSPCSPPVSPIRGEGCERRPPDYFLSRSVDHLGSLPLSLPRPGQLLCCGSVDLLSGGDGYPRRIRPTLVIPAHYMRLPGEHPLCGQALFLQTDQQSDLETIQAELNASHSQQPLGQTHTDYATASANQGLREGQGEWSSLSESLSIPTALGEAGIMQMNGEDTLLAEKKLMELRGGKPLTHPRAWFVSLDGRSNAIRHSYIDLQRAGQAKGNPGGGGSHGNNSGGRHVNGNDASLDSGVDLNEPRAGRRGREVGEREREKDRERGRTKSGPPAMAYTQLVYVDDLDGPDSEEEGETPECSPQDSPLGPVLQNTQGHQEEEEEEHRGEGMIQEEAPSPLSSPSSSSPPPLPEPEGVVFRTEHDQTALLAVAPDDHGEEEKKSPWQKREERPLLAAFNLK
ncbi:protein FAM171A1-like isoform X1 [Coregonus clupeaformis]|uniref:protein FAM171A1-like isoform X1 n=1 Tax=Coregonus clupeaformis TaxID=59861 RepID=UPI001E1C4DFC|nr:protein FAM171A1-like isoform X1 [Coregonus clupeaformis]